MEYRKLDDSNFNQNTLDGFIRHQEVKECWRKIDGEWQLVPNVFEENWPLQECRETAGDIARHMNKDQTAFGAFDGSKLVGFITVSHRMFGSTARYAELVCFQVSEPYRNQGIGKHLFALACQEAVRLGAEKLYISAHSSKESQAAYRAFGCVLAAEINETLAEKEPCDVQLEYKL
ncbi:MAG: GNAT family N-acetyltransferase [Eubacteriales bacterium]|nr:GNAT family N-acetyltransferase [Eubacteriales bacterium]